MNSDKEPTIIAFRNRAAENCNAEVALKDAVKGDNKPSNRLVDNAVMLLRGVIRSIKCHVESCTQEELREDSPIFPVVGGTCGEHFVHVPEGSRRSDAVRKIAWQKEPTEEFVPFEEKALARPISSEPLNRMNPRYRFGVWLGVRNHSAECFVGTAEGVFRVREVRRIEQQDRWDK